MSMTREEARIELQAMKDTFEEYEPGGSRCQMALKVALTALRPVSREQVEKVWRGEWKPTEYPFMNECEDCSVCGYRTVWGHGFDFCPACGAAQTDKAVDMVMKRLEALRAE